MSTMPMPRDLAEDAVRAILRTQYERWTGMRLDSPPGAGKTFVVELLAAQAMGLLGERCMVVTQTNEQAFDLGRRLARGFPSLQFVLFVKQNLFVPEDLLAFINLRIARRSSDVPHSGPCVVVSNAWRWSWMDVSVVERFDCQLVDEAFQLPDHRFHEIAGMADRLVLVGDPGQIAPVISAKIERWRCDPAGPHVPAPEALLQRHPEVPLMSLPVSRRLVPDTVRFVQPAFYPRLPFRAMSDEGDRGLRTAVGGALPLDRAIDLAVDGASLVQLELPSLVTGETDEELADTIVGLIERLLLREATVFDDGEEHRLEPRMIGVVCAHASQVNAVQERLPRHMSEVFVETANRFQGLERPVMLVHHPLSGRADADQFHLDAGRLCVMTSRHRITCFLFARAGIEELLLRYAPSGERVLRSERDEEYEGWRAHLYLLSELRDQARVVRLS